MSCTGRIRHKPATQTSFAGDGRRYLTAPDHLLEAASVEAKYDGYWLQRR